MLGAPLLGDFPHTPPHHTFTPIVLLLIRTEIITEQQGCVSVKITSMLLFIHSLIEPLDTDPAKNQDLSNPLLW